MTKYFITGGLGFIGQYIVKALHDHDRAATLGVLTRTRRSTHLKVEQLDRVQITYGDLTRPTDFEGALGGVDTVVHNAALVSFRKSEADAVFQSNVIGSRNLLQAALRAGCRNFIFISSISAVGAEPPRESDETMWPEPEVLRRTNMYGYSKVTTELELKELAGKMRVITLNPSVVLGPGSNRIRLILRAARLLPVLPMPSYINSFVDVRDVAQAVILALTRGRSGERYIVTAHHEDMLEFTRQILEAMGKRTRLIPVAGRGVIALDGLLGLLDLLKLNPGIRRISEMSTDHRYSTAKIRAEMGWAPAFTLQDSILSSCEPAP